jgi:hypothetical protein
LLEEFVDFLQFLLDLECFRYGHRLPAGELVLRGEFVDLIFLAEAFDEAQQLIGELRMIVLGGVPEPFEVAELLLADVLAKAVGQTFRRLRLVGLLVKLLVGGLLNLFGLVGLEDFAFAFAEDLHEGVDARPEAANLARVEVNRTGQLFLGETAGAAVEEEMLEGGRHHVGRRRGRAGEVNRVVFLIGVDDAAEVVLRGHRGILSEWCGARAGFVMLF